MSELFDDISRVIGSQLPRRRLLKLLAGVLAGGAIGALRTSNAQTTYACGQEFTLTGRASIEEIDCENLIKKSDAPAFLNARKNCLAEARLDAQADAKARCPPMCPSPVERSWEEGNADCSLTNKENLTCWGNGRFVCRGFVVSPIK